LPFPYPEVAVPAGSRFALTQFPPTPRVPGNNPAPAAEREAQAREAGRLQAELQARAKLEEQLLRERTAIAQAVNEFARERAAYYRKIEEEAVRLALSIARKVLRREAQIDPLLLMGILRVALDRIEGATSVVLAVPPQQGGVWRNYLTTRMDAGELPEVVEDPTMAPEQCQLRTSMGTADLGLEVQLKEIEHGLMDLLAARPGAKP
jgi:flagellar assembly protein FliH